MRFLSSVYFLPILILIFSVFSGIIIYRSTTFVNDNHLILLADSFSKKNLALSPNYLPGGDYDDYKGQAYLYFGPLISILLTPIVKLFGINFPQIVISFFSIIFTYFITFLLVKKMLKSTLAALWLSNFFVFGTVFYFVSLVDISAYTIQSLGTSLIMLSLYEYFTKRRWLLIGTIIALAGLDRNPLFLVSIFYFIMFFKKQKIPASKKQLILFTLPLIIAVLLLFTYNTRRFNNPFDSGYSYNITLKNYPMSSNVKFGIFSFRHLPANIYALLIKAPDPILQDGGGFVLKFPFIKADSFGMALWFTSPLFLFLLKIRKEDYTIPAFITIFIISLPSLFYFGIGFSQFGYRYSLDFLPLLFVILLPTFKKQITNTAILFITYGIFFNCLFMLSIWNLYPLFPFIWL